jgi:GNAT superfamily N-acetyltransferase
MGIEKMPNRDADGAGRPAPVIREASAEDHHVLAAQFQALNIHEEVISHDRRTDHAGAIEALAAAWRGVRESDGHALVAEHGGCLVGYLFLQFKDDAVFVREELRPYAYVSELFVSEAARGAGVGAALMLEAERLAAARGVRRMMVGVLAGNAAAERLYARLGFAPRAIELVKAIGSS